MGKIKAGVPQGSVLGPVQIVKGIKVVTLF